MPHKHDREAEKKEAERAVSEGGGGVAEGFEIAEEELEGQASHRDESVDPQKMAADERAHEPEVNGEADEVESTETDEDTQGTPADYDHSADEKKK
jgi:hypothetical protein